MTNLIADFFRSSWVDRAKRAHDGYPSPVLTESSDWLHFWGTLRESLAVTVTFGGLLIALLLGDPECASKFETPSWWLICLWLSLLTGASMDGGGFGQMMCMRCWVTSRSCRSQNQDGIDQRHSKSIDRISCKLWDGKEERWLSAKEFFFFETLLLAQCQAPAAPWTEHQIEMMMMMMMLDYRMSLFVACKRCSDPEVYASRVDFLWWETWRRQQECCWTTTQSKMFAMLRRISCI